MSKVLHISNSMEETLRLGEAFAKLLKAQDIVFLKGDLGAGKTVFTKGIATSLGLNPQSVNSPTFVLMNFYEGKLPLYHFDLYRLEKPEELKSVSIDEYFYGDGISIIEWPERLGLFSPKDFWLVELTHQGGDRRRICISYPSNPQRKISL